jgi:hypothetical protein
VERHRGGDKTAHACGNQLFGRKHNPFETYGDVRTSPARMANVVVRLPRESRICSAAS